MRKILFSILLLLPASWTSRNVDIFIAIIVVVCIFLLYMLLFYTLFMLFRFRASVSSILSRIRIGMRDYYKIAYYHFFLEILFCT